jgi:hypothetical protein
MKTFLLASFLCILSFSLFAQSTKTVIYCSIDPIGRTYYGDLNKLLPDSLKTRVLVDVRKQFNLRDPDHVLLWMTMNGWKLISVQSNVTGGGMISTNYIYRLSKEIYLDPAARDIFMQNLLNSEKKPVKK